MKPKKWNFKWLIAAILPILGFCLAANEFEASRKEREVEAADIAYSRLLQNLGSESTVVRIGAIGQIARQIRRKVPVLHHPYPWEGVAYLFGLTKPKTAHPYHDDLQAMVRALLSSPKNETVSGLESAAIIGLLSDLGPEGWYAASNRRDTGVSSDGLRWVWENAPNARLGDSPAYTLFRGALLAHASFARLQMDRAEFTGAKLAWASFSYSRLEGSSFAVAHLSHVSFEGASLKDADFGHAVLDDVRFDGADLDGAHFEGADLRQVGFVGVRNLNRTVGLTLVKLGEARSR